jgi:hypothetical protein
LLMDLYHYRGQDLERNPHANAPSSLVQIDKNPPSGPPRRKARASEPESAAAAEQQRIFACRFVALEGAASGLAGWMNEWMDG